MNFARAIPDPVSLAEKGRARPSDRVLSPSATEPVPVSAHSGNARSRRDWVKLFIPEGEACVKHRQQLGDYVSDPAKDARIYAEFAATDAMLKGPAFQTVDFDRARDVAERQARKGAA